MLGDLSFTQGLRLHLVKTHRLNPRWQELQRAYAVTPHRLQQVKGFWSPERVGVMRGPCHHATSGLGSPDALVLGVSVRLAVRRS